MYFHTVANFLHMGGYAGYVWSTYSITFLILFATLLKAFFKRTKSK